jgi:metal-responsive CopG/Arc/MetJ family transcriptional regulator
MLKECFILDKEKKLIISPQKYCGETTVISLRLPKNMLADIDMVANETGRTRNEILMLSMEFALEHMEIEKK